MWNEERVELLKKLWADGLSASQIANELGGVTRNAVIGKVHRLNLSGRAKPAGSGTPRPRRANAMPRSSGRAATHGNTALKLAQRPRPAYRPAPMPVEEIVAPVSLKASILTLTDQMCKWPHGDPVHEDFNFCGNKSKANTPYCDYHFRVAYQPVTERRRDRRIIGL